MADGENQHGRKDNRVSTALILLCVSLNRSINAFLLVYLCILISKAVVCTTLKHIWQNQEGPDRAWYNPETQKEKDTYLVSETCPAMYCIIGTLCCCMGFFCRLCYLTVLLLPFFFHFVVS